MANWISSLQSVAFKDNVSVQTIEEDNDLYCTSGEGVFSVRVVETEASRRCGLSGKSYTLIVAAETIKLMDGDSVLYTWPYRFIRRYGYREGKFTFEAGRKCESGEGSFRLEHSNQREIFRCISSKMKSMKSKLLEKSESSPSIEFNDPQFHAALSMEAGSRSPLPPSPNNSGNLIDIDFSIGQMSGMLSHGSQSSSSQKHLLSSSSLDSIPLFIKQPPTAAVKPKPAKPPRRHVLPLRLPPPEKKTENLEELCDFLGISKIKSGGDSGKGQSEPTTESAAGLAERHSYDSIEVRSDAWRTHGIDNVIHTERPKDKSNNNERPDDAPYETMFVTSMSSASGKCKEDAPITLASPIIHATPLKTDQDDYDKLQHFGSSQKLGFSPGYRNPSLLKGQYNLPGNLDNENGSNWPNYEVVEDMCPVRLADDSHLGYGMIRKKTVNNEPVLQHRVCNDSEYAIVSKPKRV